MKRSWGRSEAVEGLMNTQKEGVMDWMTEEWANTVYEEAWDEAEKAGAVPEPFVAIYIALAAARKVVEWLEKNNMAPTDTLFDSAADGDALHVFRDDGQALKQEVA